MFHRFFVWSCRLIEWKKITGSDGHTFHFCTKHTPSPRPLRPLHRPQDQIPPMDRNYVLKAGTHHQRSTLATNPVAHQGPVAAWWRSVDLQMGGWEGFEKVCV